MRISQILRAGLVVALAGLAAWQPPATRAPAVDYSRFVAGLMDDVQVLEQRRHELAVATPASKE